MSLTMCIVTIVSWLIAAGVVVKLIVDHKYGIAVVAPCSWALCCCGSTAGAAAWDAAAEARSETASLRFGLGK